MNPSRATSVMPSIFQFKQFPIFTAEKRKINASTQREINMVREAAQNTIGHIQDILIE